MIGKIKSFGEDVVKEMKKVSWPTKEQLRESTMVVIATSLIFTVFVWVVDQLMTLLVTMIFS